jgi:hypothetical protein
MGQMAEMVSNYAPRNSRDLSCSGIPVGGTYGGMWVLDHTFFPHFNKHSSIFLFFYIGLLLKIVSEEKVLCLKDLGWS